MPSFEWRLPLEVVEAWQLPLARPEVLLLGDAGTIPAAHYSDVKVAAVYLIERCLAGGLVTAAEVLHANEFRGAKALSTSSTAARSGPTSSLVKLTKTRAVVDCISEEAQPR